MATKFGTFRHKLTGQVVSQPEHYGRLFPDVYEEVDPTNLRCTDCGVPEAESDAANVTSSDTFAAVEPEPETQTVDLYEPEPVKRSRRKSAE